MKADATFVVFMKILNQVVPLKKFAVVANLVETVIVSLTVNQKEFVIANSSTKLHCPMRLKSFECFEDHFREPILFANEAMQLNAMEVCISNREW